MKILFFGDVVGKTGRRAIAKVLPDLKKKYHPDLVVANAENVAHGKGITISTLNALIEAGVDFFTSGNHIFDKPESKEVFEKYPEKIIRPANFRKELPGKGFAIVQVPAQGRSLPVRQAGASGGKAQSILLINLNGQVFMDKQFDFGDIENPFAKLNEILDGVSKEPVVRILDFHAEATSEKRAMGLWSDGRLSAVLGTHTHVATADAQILPLGTGYQTDVGMVGAKNSVIGVDKDKALKRLTQKQDEQRVSLEVADVDEYEISFTILEIDEETGKCQNIKSQTKFLPK